MTVVNSKVGVAAAVKRAVEVAKKAGEDAPSLSAKGGADSIILRADGDKFQFTFEDAAAAVAEEWIRLGNAGEISGKKYRDGVFFLKSDGGVNPEDFGYISRGKSNGTATAKKTPKMMTAAERLHAAEMRIAELTTVILEAQNEQKSLRASLPELKKAVEDEAAAAKKAAAEEVEALTKRLEELKSILAGKPAAEPQDK